MLVSQLLIICIIHAGPPATEYLYHPLDVESVTLKGSLLPAST